MTALDRFLTGLGPIQTFILVSVVAIVLSVIVALVEEAVERVERRESRTSELEERKRLNAVLISEWRKGRVR